MDKKCLTIVFIIATLSLQASASWLSDRTGIHIDLNDPPKCGGDICKTLDDAKNVVVKTLPAISAGASTGGGTFNPRLCTLPDQPCTANANGGTGPSVGVQPQAQYDAGVFQGCSNVAWQNVKSVPSDHPCHSAYGDLERVRNDVKSLTVLGVGGTGASAYGGPYVFFVVSVLTTSVVDHNCHILGDKYNEYQACIAANPGYRSASLTHAEDSALAVCDHSRQTIDNQETDETSKLIRDHGYTTTKEALNDPKVVSEMQKIKEHYVQQRKIYLGSCK